MEENPHMSIEAIQGSSYNILYRKLMVSSVVTKTQEYLDIFSRFKNQESVKAVDLLLNSIFDLEPYEKAQLGKNGLSRDLD